jgi:hypothetical protein
MTIPLPLEEAMALSLNFPDTQAVQYYTFIPLLYKLFRPM